MDTIAAVLKAPAGVILEKFFGIIGESFDAEEFMRLVSTAEASML